MRHREFIREDADTTIYRGNIFHIREDPSYKLRIGVIGRSPETVRSQIFPYLRVLECAGYDHGCTVNSYTLRVNDDETEYFMLNGMTERLGGMCFDQIIICDKDLGLLYCHKEDLIAWAKTRLRHSYVPEKFQIIQLKY